MQPCQSSSFLACRSQDFANTDCHLYLWTTNRSLPKGFQLLEAWGFRYVTMLTWVKPHFGMGNYFRGQTEHVLFGVRGSLALKRKDQGTVFSAPPRQGWTFIEAGRVLPHCGILQPRAVSGNVQPIQQGRLGALGGKSVSDFQKDLEFAQNFPFDVKVLEHIFPGSIITKATPTGKNDGGIDLKTCFPCGKIRFIDLKTRRDKDRCKRMPLMMADVVIEVVSVMKNGRVIKWGWTIDETKQTDYILWTYEETARWHLAPFDLLRRAALLNMRHWLAHFGWKPSGEYWKLWEPIAIRNGLPRKAPSIQPNKGYDSACIFVPSGVIHACIAESQSGILTL